MRDRLREVHREIAPVVLNAKGKDVFARHRKCGVCRRETAGVELKLGRTGVASFVGLVLCGSVWACPPCSYVICRKRAEELRTVLTRHAAIGGGDCMLTLTTPHDLGDALKPMRQQTARAWRFVCSGNPWKRVRARYGIQFVRGAEVTHGANGWHPHLHVVLLTRRPLSDAQQRELEGFFWRRWSRAITKPHKETGTQYRVPLEGVGARITRLGREDYLAKLGLGDEVASAVTKSARPGHRTAFQILYDIWRAKGANAADIALWREYVAEMQGAKQLTWSAGLRKRYALAEQTDLELVEANLPDGPTVYAFSNQVWADFVAPHVERRIRLKQTAERYPLDEAADRIVRMLDRWAGLEPVPF
ncbi:MAG TPA: hypothetical protein VI670_28215 [Thermoanaerobaculia bacterium]|jgi:hypothetical protein